MVVYIWDELMDRFPFLLQDSKGKKYGYGVECGPGWYDLIYKMLEEIELYYKKNGSNIDEFVIVQIKEKYAELRVYYEIRYSNREVTSQINIYQDTEEIINKYVDLSSKTCHECGQPGRLHDDGGWLSTLCDECAKE